jgi:hypothetical protein
MGLLFKTPYVVLIAGVSHTVYLFVSRKVVNFNFGNQRGSFHSDRVLRITAAP